MKKEIYVEIIRVFATLLVVFGHCTFFTISTAIPDMGCDYTTTIIDNTYTWQITNQIVKFIYTFHMPLFFVLSGFVYGLCIKQGKYAGYKSTITNKFRNLVLPYFAISILFNIPIYWWAGYFGNDFRNVGLYLLGFGENHLWFLIALFYCFLLAHYIHVYHSKHEILISIIISIILWLLSKVMPYQAQALYFDRLMQYYIWFIFGRLLYNIKDRHLDNRMWHSKFRNKEVCFKTTILKLVLFLSALIVTVGWDKNVIPLGGTILALLLIILIFIVVSDMNISKVERISKRTWFRVIDKYSKYIFYYGVPVNYLILGLIDRHSELIVFSEFDSFILIFIRFLGQVFLPILICIIVKTVSRYLKRSKETR